MLRIITIYLVLCTFGGDTKRPSKIVNGYMAWENEFPHQVSLRVWGQHICGGSIISPRHILTAAHCVVDDNKHLHRNMAVLSGTNDRYSLQSGQLHKVSNIIYHHGYTPSDNWRNDIAVLVLEKPMIFNSRQQPIRLPSHDIPPKTRVMASGWGALTFADPSSAPQRLQKLDMTIVSNQECEEMHGKAIYPCQICVFNGAGRGVCVGDSGGPLTYEGQVFGIASWVAPCALGYPDVFTRVHYFVPWINDIMRRY
ncbi:chymotrypsin-1-like [Microplitis demolitor]|uniref:chymotrypsin-1-like n=1 Tax=Microplitis demolitor TaxID=69319 RepID=UPI00235B6452|nr:chymotrypsin-1-like [Microplitis demolitor]